MKEIEEGYEMIYEENQVELYEDYVLITKKGSQEDSYIDKKNEIIKEIDEMIKEITLMQKDKKYKELSKKQNNIEGKTKYEKITSSCSSDLCNKNKNGMNIINNYLEIKNN